MKILVISVLFSLVGCVAENERNQQVADRNYSQCAHDAAKTLALSSSAPADVVADMAARSCPDHLKMVEGARALPLGAAAAAQFADDLVHAMEKTLVTDVEQARRGAQNNR
jgi:hypothetical protein